VRKSTTRTLVILGLLGLGIWLASRRAEAMPPEEAPLGALWKVGDILQVDTTLLEVVSVKVAEQGLVYGLRFDSTLTYAFESALVNAGAVKVG